MEVIIFVVDGPTGAKHAFVSAEPVMLPHWTLPERILCATVFLCKS
jgi:hypothetical protein